jgi:hypothetical protein
LSQFRRNKKNGAQSGGENGSFYAVLKAVLWSFFGVRRSDKHTQDMQNLNPIHVIVVGVCAAVLFVITLILIVNLVVS